MSVFGVCVFPRPIHLPFHTAGHQTGPGPVEWPLYSRDEAMNVRQTAGGVLKPRQGSHPQFPLDNLATSHDEFQLSQFIMRVSPL